MHVVVQLLHVDDYVLIYYVHVDTLYTCTVVVQLLCIQCVYMYKVDKNTITCNNCTTTCMYTMYLHVDDYVCIYYVHVDTLCTCMLVLCEYMCIQNMNVY